ncbi:MAG: hypothetical protein ABUT20_17135 [Bacteroidota bacterium]
MKGIIFLRNQQNNRQILQIDVKEIARNPSKFEDLMDVLIAEARKDEKKITWQAAKKQLKKAGKL